MANLKTAKKRAKVAVVRRDRNAARKSALRTSIKNVRTAVEAGDKDLAQEKLALALKNIDQAASKGLLHKNNAARKKTKITKAVNAMA